MADKKNLKYFMRSMEPEIVTAPGLDSIRDENGEVIPLEIKVLSQEEINRINEAYRKRSMATDKKGNPLIAMGEVVWKTEKDSARASRHLIVEALQFPNLKDKELMPLQTILRDVLITGKIDMASSGMEMEAVIQKLKTAQTLKYSVIVVSTVPLMLVYPFIQKYFVKGIMLGAVKG